MNKPRGLNHRMCRSCGRLAPHRTLYAKTEAGGRLRWFRLFWACTDCNALNHIIVPTYRLNPANTELASSLLQSIVDILKDKPLNFNDVLLSLRAHRGDVRHVFDSDVRLAMEYLTRRGTVIPGVDDLTERNLAELSAVASESIHLGPCPAELDQGVAKRNLISLYAHHCPLPSGQGVRRSHRTYSSVGVLCLRCLYHSIDLGLRALPRQRELGTESLEQ